MAENEPHAGSRQDGGDRQRRLDALRDLARDSEQAPKAPPAAQPAPAQATLTHVLPGAPRRTWRIAMIGGLLALALVIVGAGVAFVRGPLTSLSARHTGPSLSSRIVTLGDKAKLYCPTDAVWSPDGRRIAVLTQTYPSLGQCGQPTNQVSLTDALYSNPGPSHAIGIIDAASGRLVKTLPFALPTAGALCGKCATDDNLDAYYNGYDALSWSPDGKRIGFFFAYALPLSRGDVNGEQLYGVLQLIPTDGVGAVRTLQATAYMQPGPDKPYPIKLWHTAPVYFWNLSTGIGAFSTLSGEVGAATTPFAQIYGWTPSGRIAPRTSASAETFTPWSGGSLSSFNDATRILTYTTILWRWSPDGQYVAPNMTTQAFVRAPGVLDSPPDVGSGEYVPSLVQTPDAAMSAYVREVGGPNEVAQIAWSPNGKLFAGLDCQRGADAARVSVRRTSDGGGKLSGTFTYLPTQYSHNCDGDMQTLAWSSDNVSIASCDATTDQVVIWRYHG